MPNKNMTIKIVDNFPARQMPKGGKDKRTENAKWGKIHQTVNNITVGTVIQIQLPTKKEAQRARASVYAKYMQMPEDYPANVTYRTRIVDNVLYVKKIATR